MELPPVQPPPKEEQPQKKLGYWEKRRRDHRPPPLPIPVNERGEVLEWAGPAHRKPQSPQAVTDGPPKKQRKKRNLKRRFWNPQQVKPRDYKYVKILGKVGWVAKALVYSIIGGQCCNTAVGDEDDSISPQGAFILVGSASIGNGLLVVMGIAIALYAAWRFWEGITGQGSDAANSKGLNFFRYRLSPIVSGGVYCLYAVFVLTLLPKDKSGKQNAAKNSKFPDSWAHNGAGKAGLALAGIAFVAAFLVQLEGGLTRSFHVTLKPKDKLPGWLYWITIVSGHIGFLARGAVFMAVAILFFNTINNSGNAGGKTAIGDALAQFGSTPGGEAGLFILGTGLVVYGLFATLNGLYVREFPTRVPSGVPAGYLPKVMALGPLGAVQNIMQTNVASQEAKEAEDPSRVAAETIAVQPRKAKDGGGGPDTPNGHSPGELQLERLPSGGHITNGHASQPTGGIPAVYDVENPPPPDAESVGPWSDAEAGSTTTGSSGRYMRSGNMPLSAATEVMKSKDGQH